MRLSLNFILLLFVPAFFSYQGSVTKIRQTGQTIHVPLGGNTWASNEAGEKCITKQGIQKWSDVYSSFTSFLRIQQAGSFHVKLKAKLKGQCQLLITIAKISKPVVINASDSVYDVGEWHLKDTGYVGIHLSAVKKAGNYFADISEFEISGTAITSQTAFVKNDEGNFFYWGRRGPSVHLNYPLPDTIKARWFYNEVTVPAGQDVIGSYFMANGFAEGYFGIQVNSATERRILFSVWSPYSTDDPKKIPANDRIQLIKKGDDVHAGEFGNEGSGGQSFLRYNWKAGITYKFLLGAAPDSSNYTTYTAYFFDPEKGKWILIASFSRPKTNTYLKRLHSFLENFIPEQGDKTRRVLFGNQWVQNINGNWTELAKAEFTYDNTAAKKYRMDYQGGIEKNQFYLKDCGFFNEYTPYKTKLERPGQNKIPQIDFNRLP